MIRKALGLRAHSCLVLILSLPVLMPSVARAANATWTGATDLQWGTGTNWNTSSAPGAIGTVNNTDIATFNTGAGGVIAIDTGRNIRGISFGASAGAFTIGTNAGPALNLTDGGSITSVLGVTATQTIAAPLVIQPTSGTGTGAYSLINNASNVDTVAGTSKLNVTGAISGGTTTSTVTLTLGGTVGTRNAGSSAAALQQANTISGRISNGGAAGGLGITISGTTGSAAQFNAWNLTNATNDFSGNVNVTAGALYFNSIGNIGQNSALGTGANGTITIGSFLMYTGGAVTTNRTFTTTGGSFHNNGTGAMTLNGAITNTGGVTFRGGAGFIVNGLITGTGAVANNGSLTTTLSNTANSFTGNLNIQDGIISTASIANRTVASAIGAGSNIALGQASNLVGTLNYTGAAASSNRGIILNNSLASGTGNGRILANGTGTLTLTQWVRAASATATNLSNLEIGGSGNGIITGVVGGTGTVDATPGAASATNITKTGTGTWEFRAANNYTGTTGISAGTFLATNTTGSATGTGNVSVTGTGTLGGTGFVTASAGGTIGIAANTQLMVGNTHGVAAGSASTAGYTSQASVLTLGSNADVGITLAGNLQFDLFGNQAGTTLAEADRLNLFTTAAGITLGGVITVNDASGSTGWTSGTWQLIDWAGIGSATKNGTFTYNLSTSPLARGYAWDTSQFLNDGTISIAANAYIWTGLGGNSSWATAGNWTGVGGVPPTGSGEADATVRDVVFGSVTAGATTTGTWSGDQRVTNVYFTDPATNYSIGGGSSTLYTFGTLLESVGGTHTFNANLRMRSVVGTNDYTIDNDGTLNFNAGIMYGHTGLSGTTNTKNLIFTGTGITNVSVLQVRGGETMNIIKNDTGTVTIQNFSNVDPTGQGVNAAGNYIGKTTLNNGRYRINNEQSLGRVYGSFTADHLTLNGGTLSAFASFTMDDVTRGITVGANGGKVEVEGNFTLTVDNVVTSTAGSGAFEKTGTGTLELTRDQSATWAGNTIVTSGRLLANNDTGSATGTGNVLVNAGATLGGTGSITGRDAGSITLSSNSQLLVGSTHGLGGIKHDLVLGAATGATNLAINLNGTLQFDIFGAGKTDALGSSVYNDLAGVNNDLLELYTLGAINLTGAQVQLAALDTSAWVNGHTWKLIDWSNADYASRDTTGLNLATTTINGYVLTQTITDDGYYVTANIIPEPSRVLLLGAAFGWMLMRRKRKTIR